MSSLQEIITLNISTCSLPPQSGSHSIRNLFLRANSNKPSPQSGSALWQQLNKVPMYTHLQSPGIFFQAHSIILMKLNWSSAFFADETCAEKFWDWQCCANRMRHNTYLHSCIDRTILCVWKNVPRLFGCVRIKSTVYGLGNHCLQQFVLRASQYLIKYLI